MSDEFRCPHIETCPNVLQACERKVKAEGAMEVFKAKAKEYEEKRPLMNALYSAGLAMRKAQKKYFSERSKEALIVQVGWPRKALTRPWRPVRRRNRGEHEDG